MAHLTIPAGEPWVSYTPGGSSTGPFNVTFPIFSTSDLNVMVDGVLLSSSDWTFTSTDARTGGDQAGYITLDTATTAVVVIYRDTTRSRTSDYASGPLDIDTLNSDVDRTVARDQDLKMLIDRSIRQPMNDAAAIGRLPAKADRASKYLAFDANGDPTAIAYALSTTGVSAFMATVLDDVDAATARTTLGAQASDATLSALAGLSIVDNGLIRGTGADAFEVIVSTPVAQVVSSVTGAVATGTTLIPYDDTIPQNTEGDHYMSCSITPKNANNLLMIDVVWNGAHSGASGTSMVAALFKDSEADARAAGHVLTGLVAGTLVQIVFRYFMTAGAASLMTFRVRAGSGSAGTTTFNGQNGLRRMGGVMASSITITEIWA